MLLPFLFIKYQNQVKLIYLLTLLLSVLSILILLILIWQRLLLRRNECFWRSFVINLIGSKDYRILNSLQDCFSNFWIINKFILLGICFHRFWFKIMRICDWSAKLNIIFSEFFNSFETFLIYKWVWLFIFLLIELIILIVIWNWFFIFKQTKHIEFMMVSSEIWIWLAFKNWSIIFLCKFFKVIVSVLLLFLRYS